MADDNIPPLSAGLKRAIDEKMREREKVEGQLNEAERQRLEKFKKMEEEKKKAEIELSQRTSEFTLSSLHRVIRNPDIIRYMEEVGDLLVYSKDRGFGNNMIFFSKNERKDFQDELNELNKRREEVENSNLIPVEKENDLKDIDDRIEVVKKDLDRLVKEGGIIYLYLQSKDTYFRLDMYSKEEKIRDQSVSLMKVYFGMTERITDCFNEFNTPERIMEQIEKNMKDDKYCHRLKELREKLKKIKKEL
ncbi:MAG: hypothetical protein HY279_09880 [Nitrospinae bacterium]|nr:hypothetical protein [Nitrospinota bacterium]